MPKRIFIFLSMCLFANSLFAQSQKPDTAFLQVAFNNAIATYNNSIKDQSALYNGSEYVAPKRTNEQHAFFQSDDWMTGNVNYDGDTYKNLSLMYDITADLLVTELYNSTSIYLVSEKIKSFSLDRNNFERLLKEDYQNTIPQTGFYQVLYGGPTKIIARKQKSVQEKIREDEVQQNFKPRTRYYIFKDNQYFLVTSKSSLLKVLKDEQRKLKDFSKQNKLKFNRDREGTMVKLAEFYDTLKSNRS